MDCARAREDLKSTEVFHVEHPVDNPRENSKNQGLTWVELLMRSTDPIEKCGKKTEFSIFFYSKGLTLIIDELRYETSDT